MKAVVSAVTRPAPGNVASRQSLGMAARYTNRAGGLPTAVWSQTNASEAVTFAFGAKT